MQKKREINLEESLLFSYQFDSDLQRFFSSKKNSIINQFYLTLISKRFLIFLTKPFLSAIKHYFLVVNHQKFVHNEKIRPQGTHCFCLINQQMDIFHLLKQKRRMCERETEAPNNYFRVAFFPTV